MAARLGKTVQELLSSNMPAREFLRWRAFLVREEEERVKRRWSERDPIHWYLARMSHQLNSLCQIVANLLAEHPKFQRYNVDYFLLEFDSDLLMLDPEELAERKAEEEEKKKKEREEHIRNVSAVAQARHFALAGFDPKTGSFQRRKPPSNPKTVRAATFNLEKWMAENADGSGKTGDTPGG